MQFASLAVFVLFAWIAYVTAQPCSPVLQEDVTKTYWTSDRMDNAIPRDFIIDPLSGTISLKNKIPGVVPVATPNPCNGVFTKWTNPLNYTTYPFTAVGKVFFSLGANNYVCSGAIVDSNTVWTAGHCTFDSALGYATNFMFVPSYNNRAEPYGRYAARSLCAASGYQAGTMSFDYALATFTNSFPAELSSLILTGNLDAEKVNYQSWGYPQAAPFDGMWENTCFSDCCGRRDWWMPDPQPVGIACDSTGGCSGGPWITRIDPESKQYNLVGLNSYGYSFQPKVLWGPYYDTLTLQFYNTYKGTAK